MCERRQRGAQNAILFDVLREFVEARRDGWHASKAVGDLPLDVDATRGP